MFPFATLLFILLNQCHVLFCNLLMFLFTTSLYSLSQTSNILFFKLLRCSVVYSLHKGLICVLWLSYESFSRDVTDYAAAILVYLFSSENQMATDKTVYSERNEGKALYT